MDSWWKQARQVHNGENTRNGGFSECVHFCWVTIEGISKHLGISVGTAHKTVQDDLAFFLRLVVFGFLQDNVRTVKTINQPSWDQLTHPPYSSSDFHLFGTHKEFLHRIKFSRDDKIKSAMGKWLKTQSKNWMRKEYKSLLFNGKNAFLKGGDSIDKKWNKLTKLIYDNKSYKNNNTKQLI